MKRSARIVIGIAVGVALVGLVISSAMNSKPEQGLFSPPSTHTASPLPTPKPIGPVIGIELVPVAEVARKELATVGGVPLETRCASSMGETYFAHIPAAEKPGAHSKLDIKGAVLTVTRLGDGSVLISYDDVVTGIILGEDFAFSPNDRPNGRFWVNPESFGPIIESKIGVCVRRAPAR